MAIQLVDDDSHFHRASKTKKVSLAALVMFVMVLVFLAGLLRRSLTGPSLGIRLYTHNIRYDNQNPVPGEKRWKDRWPLVSQSIINNTDHSHAVVCLQEVLHNQLEDILQTLNNDSRWEYFGVGRTDGKEAGEYAPILYKTADWTLKSARTYWLSETPDYPSRGWDAALERIVTEVVLQSKYNGKSVKVLNTHFDHKGVVARRESIKLIISKMEDGPEPSFLCGDFNTQPTDEPYAILNATDYQDSRTVGDSGDKYTKTYTSFNGEEAATIIDYIWADTKAKWRGYHVLQSKFGYYMSDHRPVVADYTA